MHGSAVGKMYRAPMEEQEEGTSLKTGHYKGKKLGRWCKSKNGRYAEARRPLCVFVKWN